MFTQEQRHTLAELFAAELLSTQELLRTLELEHDVLVRGNADELEAISVQKSEQMQQMQQQLASRDRFLERCGLPTGKPGTDRFISDMSPDAALAALWSELLAIVERLQQRNEVNGGMVALGQRHARQALDILTGQAAADLTYGPEGDQQQTTKSQSLARA